jgi:beta-glucosidase
LYVRPLEFPISRAQQDLRGVKRISLQPGQSQQVTLPIEPAKDVRRYDPEAKGYVVDTGRYEIQLGSSSRDIRQARAFTITPSR